MTNNVRGNKLGDILSKGIFRRALRVDNLSVNGWVKGFPGSNKLWEKFNLILLDNLATIEIRSVNREC